ncbi:coiled-coil domain-containing protein 38-like [Maniola hyperantus]|uniref:coiled-coil domain-containing protein 38-like n=1 Tax=Aphantopus hyperantus TaxID=2795564 RepID=UPI0015688D39|nr:uncharacterized protein LOC117988170 [Maniola hyperantus]
MLNEDNNSVIINLPKKRTHSDKLIVSSVNKKQNKVTRKCRRELSDIELKRYNLPEEVSLPISKLKQCEINLPFKHYCKQQDINRFKRRLNISIYEKYKIISTDLQKRLFVDYPLNDIYSVIDVDTEYYSYLGGRLLQLHNPVYKSLQESINKILQLKHETGTKKDCILNIETNYRNELDIYALSVKRLTHQAKYFDAFISEDYKKSMDFLSKWDKVKFQLDLMVKALQNLGIEKFTLQSRLISLEYMYGIQLKYGRFLYYLSPPIWRLNNREFARSGEIEAKGFDYGNSQDEDTFAIIFEKLRKICYGKPIRPVLYFTQPKDLMDVFDAMENQQLHYYTHVNHLTPYTKILKEEIKTLKEVIFQDYAVVANVIKMYENLLKFSEDRCAQLELKFHKILFGLFYNSIGVPDVLKLVSHLEFCYEKVFLEKPINLDITLVAKSIEIFYMDYLKRLDEIQSTTVRRAVLKCTESGRLKSKKAKNAAKELRSFYRLERTLLKSYGIDANNVYIPVKRDTNKNENNSDRNKTTKRHNSVRKLITESKERQTLTEFEKEYLLLFTDWTENEDPANYLKSYIQ